MRMVCLSSSKLVWYDAWTKLISGREEGKFAFFANPGVLIDIKLQNLQIGETKLMNDGENQ